MKGKVEPMRHSETTEEAQGGATVRHLDLVRNDRSQWRDDQRLLRELPLVHRLAHRYAYLLDVAEDELVPIACLGLVKAATDYDANCNGSFHHYAEPIVVAELERYVRSTRNQPQGLRKLLGWDRETRSARREISSAIGRQDHVQDLAVFLGCGVDALVDGLMDAVEHDGTLVASRALRGAA
jgi:DNA-directed RNA polymerase specialized sigma subunit